MRPPFDSNSTYRKVALVLLDAGTNGLYRSQICDRIPTATKKSQISSSLYALLSRGMITKGPVKHRSLGYKWTIIKKQVIDQHVTDPDVLHRLAPLPIDPNNKLASDFYRIMGGIK